MIEPFAGRSGQPAGKKRAIGLSPWAFLASSGTSTVIVLGLASVLALAPVLMYPLPPLADYPNHLARMHVIATIGSDPDLSRHYDIHWQIIPNLIMDMVVPLLTRVTDIYHLLALCANLKRPPFRAALYRALILVLYCTGIRFGEALRLRMRDVDTRSAILFVDTFKGRSRWVPFHRSLSRELDRYLTARMEYAPADLGARFFVGANRSRLPVGTASDTFRSLFKLAGLKPDKGRIGPRPYDLRHAFAVHRLSRWYGEGVDLHARLPWLSAYMGHVDIIGTESYLHTTPELLDLAGNRLRRRYKTTTSEDDSV